MSAHARDFWRCRVGTINHMPSVAASDISRMREKLAFVGDDRAQALRDLEESDG